LNSAVVLIYHGCLVSIRNGVGLQARYAAGRARGMTEHVGEPKVTVDLGFRDTPEFRQRLSRGDNEAWAQINQFVRRTFSGWNLGAADADDFIQFALLRLWAAFIDGKVPSERPLLPYVLRIARNSAIDFYRRKQRETPLTEAQSARSTLDPQQPGSVSGAQEEIIALMEGLDRRPGGSSFQFLQVVFLTTEDLQQAWRCKQRTAQRWRTKLMREVMELRAARGLDGAVINTP